jgi:hypothetical protein
MNFEAIIQHQANNKTLLNKSISPPDGGITIVIKDQHIHDVIDGKCWVHPRRRSQYIGLFENVLKKHKLNDVNININLTDHPQTGCFNFCRTINHAGQFLLPTFRFTCDDIIPNTNTYNDVVQYLFSKRLDSQIQIPKMYMSCIPHSSKVDYFKFALSNPSFCSGYVHGGTVHKYCNLPTLFVHELKENGLAGEEFISFEEHLKYKYVLYNDGNTLSDRMRLLLCTGSVIIYKTSPYEEFFTYLLKHDQNYIQYTHTNELKDIFNRLEENAELCANIRKNNQHFVETYLTYDSVLDYVSNIIQALYD